MQETFVKSLKLIMKMIFLSQMIDIMKYRNKNIYEVF